jgi:plastocyanin domain-containing protein
MSRLVLAVVLAVGLFGCSSSDTSSTQPAALAPAADGSRRIAVEAGKDGYKPDRIPGKPGENIVLVFTRTVEGECLAQLKTPDGKLVDLPLNKPVEVPVTLPQTGKLTFACGMDMFHGVIVTDT